MITTLIDACKTIGIPGVALAAMFFIGFTVADRYLDHTIAMESELQKHRIATERMQQEMLTQTLTVFVDIHQRQAEAVVGIQKMLEESESTRNK